MELEKENQRRRRRRGGSRRREIAERAVGGRFLCGSWFGVWVGSLGGILGRAADARERAHKERRGIIAFSTAANGQNPARVARNDD